MLRWFNSDAVFWPFMAGVIVMADIIGSWHVVRDWPKDNAELVALSLITLLVFRRCLGIQRNQR